MTDGKPFLPRPGMDERAVAAEMMSNQHPQHWAECRKFVKRRVYAKAKNIPVDLHEDIIQEVMYKVTKSLEHFDFRCSFKNWVNIIVEHCIIDAHRKVQHEVPYHSHPADPSGENDHESEEPGTSAEKSAEDAFIINDEIRNGKAALLEYADAHSNPTRDRLIIRMVIDEGYSHMEAAIAAGCNAPVVGYVVRQAQRYAREKMGHKL
jgi:RNA polymerase sigma factor (sigma-70 family)